MSTNGKNRSANVNPRAARVVRVIATTVGVVVVVVVLKPRDDHVHDLRADATGGHGQGHDQGHRDGAVNAPDQDHGIGGRDPGIPRIGVAVDDHGHGVDRVRVVASRIIGVDRGRRVVGVVVAAAARGVRGHTDID